MMWEILSIFTSKRKKRKNKTMLQIDSLPGRLQHNITLIKEKKILNCVETFAVSWILAPMLFFLFGRVCGEFNFFFALWWASLGEEAFSGSVLNSLWTCCVVNNWLEVWSSPRGSWSTRRRATIALHHSTSRMPYPLAVNKHDCMIGMAWFKHKLVLMQLSLIMPYSRMNLLLLYQKKKRQVTSNVI